LPFKQSAPLVVMKQVVDSFVKQCSVCQQAKHELYKHPSMLQPLPIPRQAWIDIAMDFIEGLSFSNGYSVILFYYGQAD
jgi:hypothetical protein